MKNFKRNIALFLFFILAMLNISSAKAQNDDLLLPVYTQEQTPKPSNSGYFNLANIVDSILANDAQKTQELEDENSNARKEFISISSKFNQGNAKVAYDEYSLLIDKIEDDSSLLALSKILYEIGFFSLGDKASDKIISKNRFENIISDLKTSYKPKNALSAEEEIYFAKAYTNIFFENNAQETIQQLLKEKSKYQKHDFYNFILSQAYLEAKQYNLAINTINKAASLNPDNLNYQIHKIDALIKTKKFREANKQIEKTKGAKSLLVLNPKLQILDSTVQSALSGDSKDKKYHGVYKTYLEGNFEKTKKDCLNILNFDKDNDKIISLYAKSELAQGNVERANVYFVNAYKIEKNNTDTLIGLGDIRYIHGDYKNALKMYKKALKKDKTNYEAIIKLSCAQRQYAKYPKEIKKLELALDKMPKNDYIAYYNSAISIAQKNDVLKEEFLKRALEINPLFENAIGALVELNLKNKNYKVAQGLIFNVSFTLEKNYYYYYLCGLYNQMLDKRRDAIQFYKTSLNLNPNFEIANVKLLKLIPDIQGEEI